MLILIPSYGQHASENLKLKIKSSSQIKVKEIKVQNQTFFPLWITVQSLEFLNKKLKLFWLFVLFIRFIYITWTEVLSYLTSLTVLPLLESAPLLEGMD